MPNWNPNADVLGNEWMATRGHTHGVYSGEAGREQRLPSTVAETINSIKLSATINPNLRAETYTVLDVIPEGAEDQPLFTGVWLPPTSDVSINSWRTNTGGATNLFQTLDDDTNLWGWSGAPANADWIENGVGFNIYECQVGATDFHTGGSLVNSRIGWVAVSAILGANTGFRKMRVAIVINGVEYRPGGGGDVDVHAFGAVNNFEYGELNPATLKPWLPADIAQFRPGGNSKIRLNSWESSFLHFPKIYAVALTVFYLPTENRVAAGVWKRPLAIAGDQLINVTTNSLISLPSGAAGWSKPSGTNHLYLWRQAATPALYGAVNANDVRWNGIFQDLGSVGQPAGIVYPLTASGTVPPPSTVLASQMVTYDHLGRQSDVFVGDNEAAYGIALVRSDAAISVDSQPYRLDVSDLESVTSTQKLGQRVVPGSSLSWIGVRLMLIPPASGDPTLTVAVHRVSDGVQMGGTFTITAATARALPSAEGWRYITGFLSSGASLVSGTAYEIRLTSTAGGDWLAAVLDSSLGSTASFGGSTSGAFIGSTHFPDRELVVTMTRQPDPPTGAGAAITNVAVTTFSDVAITVPHVAVSWTAPASGMGAGFARYEIERQVASGAWQLVAKVINAGVLAWTDRTAPRNMAASYRIRAVGIDGRFSAWATSAPVTPTETRPMLVLASNHRTDLYFVHLHEIVNSGDGETVYPILSTGGDETYKIHGADYQVVFIEAEDRGVGWRTRVSLRQTTSAVKGMARFDALVDLTRALDIPYVCAVDHQGNHILGHVAVNEGVQTQPDYGYTAQLVITPTHTAPVAVEVS